MTRQEAMRYLAELCKQRGDWEGSSECHRLVLYNETISDGEFIRRTKALKARLEGQNGTQTKQETETSQRQEKEETGGRIQIDSDEPPKGEDTVKYCSSKPPKGDYHNR